MGLMVVTPAVSVVVVTLLLFILLQLPFLQVLLNSAVGMPTAAAVELALAGNKGERLLNHGLAFCSAFCAGAAFLATLLAPLGHVP